MAGSVNKVILIGNLGNDPEIRTFQNGGRIANISLATSENWKDKSTGERKERTQWHRVVVNNEALVGICEKYLKKGDKVYVEGSIEYRTWEDREGKTRYSTEITAREVISLSSRGSSNAEDHAGATVPGGKAESFDDFPEALDGEDDDLPF